MSTPWPTERPTVSFLGRHEERKGLRVLLEAFDGCRGQAGRTGRTAHAGTGAVDRRRRAPDRRRSGAAIPSRPTSSGSACSPRRRRSGGWSAADVLCAPSLGGESFGMVLLEAMAARTVVVASDIDGYRAAAGGCAVLVPPGDPRRWPTALAGVLDGPLALSDGATAAGRIRGPSGWLSAGAERADRWSMERLAEWYEGWYRSAMVGRRP